MNIYTRIKRAIPKPIKDDMKRLAGIPHRLVASVQYHLIKKDSFIPIEDKTEVQKTNIADYWTGHTVHDDLFISAKESLNYRKQIFDWYPYYREFADMDRQHEGEVILDYGCGPGNDLTWYTQMTKPKMIIGMDVSISALKNSQFRMALHGVSKEQCRLILIDESRGEIPLGDESVDFVSCQGVLMHTSEPEKILKEFYRVLKKDNTNNLPAAVIMVYNKESIWYHLYAAYYIRFVNSSPLSPYSKAQVVCMPLEEIFRRSTDGVEVPMSRCWGPEEFAEMCKSAGFSRVEYQGGYPNSLEPNLAKDYIKQAIEDDRLEDEHKRFLRKVCFDADGFPVVNGVACCIGGVYRLWV